MSTVSPGLSAAMRSAPQAVTTTRPISVTPMPKCADGGAPRRARQSRRAPQRRAERHAQDHGALDDVGDGARHDENREADAERRQHRTAVLQRECAGRHDRRQQRRRKQPLRGAEEVAALPAEQRPERHRQQQRHEQRAERRVEERRPDRNLVAGQRLERQRIERADEDGGAGRRQKQIVERRARPRAKSARTGRPA